MINSPYLFITPKDFTNQCAVYRTQVHNSSIYLGKSTKSTVQSTEFWNADLKTYLGWWLCESLVKPNEVQSGWHVRSELRGKRGENTHNLYFSKSTHTDSTPDMYIHKHICVCVAWVESYGWISTLHNEGRGSMHVFPNCRGIKYRYRKVVRKTH